VASREGDGQRGGESYNQSAAVKNCFLGVAFSLHIGTLIERQD
jgi:hypothetical protein